jgi:hypothetical protein
VLDCQPGTPVVIDDGIGCTDDSCDEVGNVVVNAVNNANCDTTNVYWKYVGDGWFGSARCNSGYSSGTYKGNYGYCQDGISTSYSCNGLFGNRNGYNEAGLWLYRRLSSSERVRRYHNFHYLLYARKPGGIPV